MKAFISIDSNRKFEIYFQKPCFFHTCCATYSELPSDKSTVVKRFYDAHAKFHLLHFKIFKIFFIISKFLLKDLYIQIFRLIFEEDFDKYFGVW